MFGLGLGEILVILVIAIVFVGPDKLPSMAKKLGALYHHFLVAKNDLYDEIRKAENTVKETTYDEFKKEFPENEKPSVEVENENDIKSKENINKE